MWEPGLLTLLREEAFGEVQPLFQFVHDSLALLELGHAGTQVLDFGQHRRVLPLPALNPSRRWPESAGMQISTVAAKKARC